MKAHKPRIETLLTSKDFVTFNGLMMKNIFSLALDSKVLEKYFFTAARFKTFDRRPT